MKLRRLLCFATLLLLCLQSAEVLLLALSGHSCLRDAMSVLRSSHQLRDLANNGAAMFAESLGTKLSSLLVALEFPALGPTLAAVEYIHVQGSAGAMPLVQVGRQRRWTALHPAAGCALQHGLQCNYVT